MTDRHRGYYHAGRPASLNPSRASLPNGIGYQSSYTDDAYVVPASSHHPITTTRGYSNPSTSSSQPTTTRTYAPTQDPRLRPRTQDHSRTRRSTMDSTARPPVIVTTTQNDRSHNNLIQGSGTHNASPARGDYRHDDAQYYAMPASTRRSGSSARPSHNEGYSHRRDRGDNLLSAHDAEFNRHPRPSVIYPSSLRHSTAPVDYGEEGYKYTNAGELVRYDLDHCTTSRSRRHDSFDRDYHRPRASYAGNRTRGDGPRYETDGGYVVTHRRDDRHSGPPPSTRGFGKINKDYDSERGRQALPSAPKPPKPLPHVDNTNSLRDAQEMRHSRPISVSQDLPYRDSSQHSRDEHRDRRELRDRSVDTEYRSNRPHSTQFYDDSVSSRGFGLRTVPTDDRRERERRGDYLYTTQPSLQSSRKPPQDRPLSSMYEGKSLESGKTEPEWDNLRDLTVGVGTGLGINVAATGLAASKRHDDPSKRFLEKDVNSPGATSETCSRNEVEVVANPSQEEAADAMSDRGGPQPGISKAVNDDPNGLFAHEGASILRAQSTSDSDDAVGYSGGRNLPLQTFDPNNTSDLRQIKEQLAALRVRGKESLPDHVATGVERPSRALSPRNEFPGNPAVNKGEESCAVGFPVDRKHARVVSPPRDKREDKPLRGILKQPSARFPEEANPVREGVAPHKEDKKLKEVPPGARWTKINRKVVNPEALTIGKERFEEREDFVIVLRVLSREEIQAYAAATQVLRERRRSRDGPGNDHERRYHVDDGGNVDYKAARDEASEGSSECRLDADKNDLGARRSRRGEPTGDEDRKRERDQGDDLHRGVDRRRARGDDNDGRDQPRDDSDRPHR